MKPTALVPLLLAATLPAQAEAELYAARDICRGTGLVPAQVCRAYNQAPYTNAILNPTTGRLVFQFQAPTAMNLTGFAVPLLFAREPGEAMVRTFVHLGDPVKGPAAQPVRRGLVHLPLWNPISPPNAPYSQGDFVPLALSQGTTFFIGLERRGDQQVLWPLLTGTGTTMLPAWVRGGGAGTFTSMGSWGLPIRLLCGQVKSRSRALLTPQSLPRLGFAYILGVSLALPGPGVLALGSRSTTLQDLLIPGTACQILTSPEVLLPFTMPTQGMARVPIPIPNLPALRGAVAFQQAFLLDRPAGGPGVVVTNGVVSVLGP